MSGYRLCMVAENDPERRPRARRLSCGGVCAAIVAIYTFVALAVNFEQAWPVFVAEVLLLIYAAWWQVRPRLARRYRGQLDRLKSAAATFRARAAAAAAAAVLHLGVLAATVDRSPEAAFAGLGLLLLVLGCYGCSTNRRGVRWWPVLVGFSLQFWLALLVLRSSAGRAGLAWLACRATRFLSHANFGRDFVFGTSPALIGTFAFGVMPVTIFFGAFCAVALHLGLLQLVFEHAGHALGWIMGVTPAEGIVTVANVFLSMTDTPLLLRPLLPLLTRAQLFTIVTGGFASVAGGVLAMYIAL